jgi:hypothetical protein
VLTWQDVTEGWTDDPGFAAANGVFTGEAFTTGRKTQSVIVN